jgi:Uma2 family endonuclease
MTTLVKQKLTFDQFLDQYPDGSGLYELVNGEVRDTRATRQHDDVAFFILFAFNDEVRRLGLDYVVNNTTLVQTLSSTGEEQGRKTDVSVIDRAVWQTNRSAYGALDKPIQLAIEVVSTNWDDDYIDKLDEYQRLGVREYWIVDYLAIGGREWLGKPKVPTVFVHTLNEDSKYQSSTYRGSDRILSPTFPELALTVDQILAV